VVHPGLVPLNGDLTVLAAIFQAGGFRPTAKTDSVVLVRDSGKGSPAATKIKLDDVFLSTPHTKLKPFDVVFVPKSRIAKLNQWVDQ
jgi:protein involved in polysaccharide export with SLBB domain